MAFASSLWHAHNVMETSDLTDACPMPSVYEPTPSLFVTIRVFYTKDGVTPSYRITCMLFLSLIKRASMEAHSAQGPGTGHTVMGRGDGTGRIANACWKGVLDGLSGMMPKLSLDPQVGGPIMSPILVPPVRQLKCHQTSTRPNRHVGLPPLTISQ